MTPLALLFLLIQGSSWNVSPAVVTVGDTVQLTRRIVAQRGARVSAAQLPQMDALVPLRRPVVGAAEGLAVVQYTIALFEPGAHTIPMPDIDLTFADGREERVWGDTAVVIVQSVLPHSDSLPPPMPSRGPVARRLRRPERTGMAVAAVVGGTLFWGLLRRRRRRRPEWRKPVAKRAEVPLAAWLKAGELKAVVTVITDSVRDRIEHLVPEASRQLSTDECLAVVAAAEPDWPHGELTEVLRSLDRARFAPAVPADLMSLAERAEQLVVSLRRSSVAGEAV